MVFSNFFPELKDSIDSLMMSLTCLEPLFSSSDRTLASKVREATRKKKSLTPSPESKTTWVQRDNIGWNSWRKARWCEMRMMLKFYPHLILQRQPSTRLWFPLRASWLLAQSDTTDQETEKWQSQESHRKKTQNQINWSLILLDLYLMGRMGLMVPSFKSLSDVKKNN